MSWERGVSGAEAAGGEGPAAAGAEAAGAVVSAVCACSADMVRDEMEDGRCVKFVVWMNSEDGRMTDILERLILELLVSVWKTVWPQ